MDRNSQQIQRGRPVSGLDAAHANEYFEQFLNATSLKHILGYYRGLTDNLHLKPNEFPLFYPKLRANLTSWRAKALWKKFDARASHKCYQKGKLAGNTRVLIIGGGPCGMRTAIEAQLLGAKVVVIEKRDRFSRNNVLHLWPFVIEDLRMLGAKKFFGKFCAGAIDHISIRQLQCILLKVALLLGVEVHTEVSFEKLVEPNATEKTGWRAEVKPANHPVHHYEFDVIIGADGKRNTLQGFSRKEFRGKLAIAITANFINRKTEAEARVEEISGVAFIFNQKFFKDLQEETRIDLENIVYYKDDTHYFVMTAKKASLLEKGVIKEDLADTEKLLAPDNVDRKALEQYAIDAANFSTNYQLPNLEFAVNHYGQPDIAMFDFTSMYAAENASKVLERNGYKLLLILVGDSLLEPFWPTGSGCARGFLSSLDAAWAIRSWSLGATTALEVLAERESIYRLLAQTTPDNLNKDWKSYTVDPTTRYPNLNKTAVLAHQVASLYDTDNPGSVEKMKRNLAEPTNEVPRKRRRGNVDNEILLGWLRQQLKEESDIQINGVESVFKGGKALCALIHHYRPDLLDYVAVKDEDPVKNNQTAFDILEKEIGIPPVMTGEEITKTDDYLTMASYLTEVYDTFRREIPHIKHPKLNPTHKKPKLLPYVETKPIARSRNKKLSRCCNSIVNIPSSKLFKKKRKSMSLSRNSSRVSFKEETIKTNQLDNRRNCGCLSVYQTCEVDGNTFCDIPLGFKAERGDISDSCDSRVHKTERVEITRNDFCDVPLIYENKRVSDSSDSHVARKTHRAKGVRRNFSNFSLTHNNERAEANCGNFCDILDKVNNFKTKGAEVKKNVSDFPLGRKPERILRNNSSDIPLASKTRGVEVDRNIFYDIPLVNKTERIKDSGDSPSVHKTGRVEVNKNDCRFIHELKESEATNLENETDILSVNKSIVEEPPKTQATETVNYCKIEHFQGPKITPKSRILNTQTVSTTTRSEDKLPVMKKSKGSFLEPKGAKNENEVEFIMEPRENYNFSDTCTETTITDTIEDFHVLRVVPRSLESKHSEDEIDIREQKIAPKPPNFVPENGNHQRDCILDEIHRNVDRCLKSMKKENNKPLRHFMTNLLLRRNKSATKNCKCAEIQQEKSTATNLDASCLVVSNDDTLITVKVIENTTSNKSVQNIEFIPSLNQLTISSKVDVCKSPSSLEDLRNNKNSDLLALIDELGRMGPPKKKFTSRKRSDSYLSAGSKTETDESTPDPSNCQCRSNADNQKLAEFPPESTMIKSTEEVEQQLYNEMSNWPKCKELAGTADRCELRGEVPMDKGTDVASVSKVDLRKPIEKFKWKCLKSKKLKAVKPLSIFSQYSPLRSQYNSTAVLPSNFSVITEGDEEEEPDSDMDLPESKKLGSELSFKTVKSGFEGAFGPPLRPSSRHKRHIEAPPSKTTGLDKKTRKRRTLEKMGSNVEERLKTLEEIACNRAERQNRRRQQRKLQTEQFLKSMQMLQANAKADSQPFEDYSIFLYRQTAPKFEDRVKDLEKQFTYVPDHDNKSALPSGRSGGTDEDLAARIKTLEKKWTEQQPVDKKPKDLMRAIGKIETTDWNIKEIEKKILENKMGKPTKTFDKEKVPKWSKEQFLARQNKMESKHLDRQDSNEVKYADIDKSIKNLDQKLKEGTIRQLGTNKVASLTEKLVSKIPNEPKTPEKNNPKTPVVVSSGSEYCHFCRKRVYLMERLSAEGRFFHHSCFKCQYCNVQLRLGSYAFDRDGMYGFRFFCLHHFGMIGEIDQSRIARKSPQKLLEHKSPEKKPLPGIAGVDLLDRVQTPERVEFANLSTDHVSSDQDEPLSQIDEDEWTDKNFGASCAELGDSDEDSSSISDTDSDDEAAFDDALEEPITKEGTMKWAERWKNSYSKKRHKSESDDYTSSDQSSYYDSSDDDESDTATEGEEEIRARELRKQEVRVDPPVVQTDTGTDTEIVSDESSSDSSSEVHNSATEISTDSEFAQDDPTPTRELPSIALNDLVTRKGGRSYPKKIQVTSGYLQRPVRESIELKLKPLVLSSPPSKPALVPSRAIESGYSLNRTQSTGGIAAKVSLELKKKYLLGESCASGIQKSGSVSTLDTKFKTFQNAITDCQKLLRPANEISASMQTFCSKLDERRSPRIAEEKPEEEVRPRSPAHQTSIIVPQIDWSKNTHLISSDSLATSDSDNNPGPNFENIPTVQVHEARDEDALFDSLIDQNAHKSITSEKKSLNQPKTLPDLETSHDSLHIKLSRKEEDSQKNSSGLSSPEEPITAALTETELSDWARDDEASDDLEDVLNECEKNKTNKFEGGKNMIITEALNGLLSSNLDNIEFMDTETSSDDGIQNSQDGYVLLKDEDEFAEDSLSPDVRIETPVKNTGYCIIEPMTPKLNANELEDDSLLVLETTTGTTTEENTLSDSTVKNVTEISAEKLENKDALEVINENTSDIEKIEFDEHCQRLQSKVEFGNAKDSINVRKSRRKSKSDSPQKPDLIQEERIDKDVITLNLSPTPHTPDILYNKEIIKKERDVNKKLIQEMVMNKMRAENKSLERKKRVRSGVSPTTPFTLAKSATVAHITTTDNVVSQNNDRKSIYSTSSSNYSTPDVLLSTNLISQLPDDFTPKAPPRLHRFNSEESHRKLEKLKQAAVKLQDKEEIEDVVNVERRDSWLYSNDTLSKKKNGSFRRSKSGDSDTPKKSIQGMPKKEINLEEKTEEDPKGKKKGKDRERRKSITKMITTLFTKKSPSGLFSKLSPKSKEISKEIAVKQPVRRNSISETTQRIALTPPPVPPLPTNYAIKATDESSDGESEYKKDHHGSSDTLDKAGTLEMSTSSNTGRRSTKAQKALRQAQLKRHRMAQEIQRKLEETEVKTKELEERGVSVEKALRGEGDLGEYTGKDECELLQEWFDLMRDRTELRRYEKELIVRAQELELEDRHARLQCELRARLENNEPKTEGELKLEEKIINEMMTIVSERDSLIATIEEDRLRYSNEDRDMEEQMLAKGLRLTPIKSPDK